MPVPASDGWLTVQKAIDCFVMMGCEPREHPEEEVVPGESWHVYYLYSPETEGFVSLTGYDLADLVAPSTIAAWERALGIEIPWGKSH